MKDIQKIKEFFSKPLDEAKEETAVDMAKKQLDALGVKYELGNKFKPFEKIYKPISKSNEFYRKFNDIVDLFSLGNAVESSMNEANVTWSTLHRDNNNERLLKQSKLSSAEYQKAKKLQGFKADNYKWNADEDLYTKVVKEATDYMKRRKSEDDYATKKPTNPNPSGKTDYQKRRETEKKLAETIFSKLKETKSTPCWKGYEQKGMKEKNGKQVPNCVPKK